LRKEFFQEEIRFEEHLETVMESVRKKLQVLQKQGEKLFLKHREIFTQVEVHIVFFLKYLSNLIYYCTTQKNSSNKNIASLIKFFQNESFCELIQLSLIVGKQISLNVLIQTLSTLTNIYQNENLLYYNISFQTLIE
jgi:hypothetical protein